MVEICRSHFPIDREHRLTDEAYFAFCVATNPDLNVELTSEGEIFIVPPPGGESDFRTRFSHLGCGRNTLRMGEKRRAWKTVRVERSVPAAGRIRIVPRCGVGIQRVPCRLVQTRAAQRKMRLWTANGVELVWLIDADIRRVYVYRGTAEPRIVTNAEGISGEGPVEGFVLPLGEIWAGL